MAPEPKSTSNKPAGSEPAAKEDRQDRRMDLSFSGAGFMGVYYFGVVDCWNKYIPRERVRYVCGASAGSLIAAYYLMDLPMNDCLREIIAFGEDMRSRRLGAFDRSNQVVDVLPRILDRIFPPDAHKRVSGRLHVVMTRLKDMKKITVNEFETRQDLIDALNCSCFIPLWSGNHVSTYKGVKHIDGGFKDNLPVFDEHTIRICCFSGATDISPYDRVKSEALSGTIQNTPVYLNWANLRRCHKALFPPPAGVLCDLLERGFQDAKQFILNNDLIQCEKCYQTLNRDEQPIFSKLSPTISPAITPNSISPAQSLNNLAFNNSGPNRINKPITVSTDGHLSASNVIIQSREKSKPTLNDRKFGLLLKDRLERCSSESALGFSSDSIDQNNNGTSEDQSLNCSTNPPAIVIQTTTIAEADENNMSGASSESGVVNCSTGDDPTLNHEEDHFNIDADLKGSSTKEKRPKRTSLGNITAGLKRSDNYFNKRRQTVANLADEADAIIGERLNASAAVLSTDRFKQAPSPLPSCPPSPSLNRRCLECARLRQQARLDLVEEGIKLEIEKFRKPKEINVDDGIINKITNPWRWIKQIGISRSYSFEAEVERPVAATKATVAL